MVSAVERRVGLGQRLVFGFEFFQLLLELLDMLFFALAERPLRCSILRAATLGRTALVCICEQAAGCRRGVAYDPHIGYGFLVLRCRRPPPSSVLVLRGCEVHKLNRVGDWLLVEVEGVVGGLVVEAVF